MKNKLIGIVDETFKMTLLGQVFVLDRDAYKGFEFDDPLEIVTLSGKKFSTRVKDMLSSEMEKKNEKKQVTSILVGEQDFGPFESLIGAKIYLVSK